jgi:hypothetical protein
VSITVARAALALLAVALTAWFAAIAYNDRIGHAAAERINANPRMGSADFASAVEDFRRAGRINPGTEWKRVEASYRLQRGQRREAIRVAEDVVRHEPDNLGAWVTILSAAGTADGRLAERARAAILRLNPLAGR